jgi:hypothetical protein
LHYWASSSDDIGFRPNHIYDGTNAISITGELATEEYLRGVDDATTAETVIFTPLSLRVFS